MQYLIFGGIAVFCIASFILSKKNIMAFWGLLSIVLLYLFTRLSKTTIVTTDKSIKISNFTGVKECSWDTIYSVSTRRLLSSGNYSTVIKWAVEPQYRVRISGFKGISEKGAKSGALDLSDHYEGYVDLLKEIKVKAVNAEIDETTEKITGGRK